LRSSGRSKGFTVIEALIAIVMLVGVMLALFGVVPRVFQNASHDAVRTQAAAVAQQYLDSLRQYVQANGSNAGLPAAPTLAIDDGDTYMGAGTPAPGASPSTFVLSNNACPLVGGTSLMYDCQVTATWTQNGRLNSLTLESYVTSEN